MPATSASTPAPVQAQSGNSRSSDMALERLGRKIRQSRALAAAQGNVRGMRPALETVHGVSQARRGLREVGRVDLLDVAEADDLGAGARAGDQRLHLLGRGILRLVDDQIARQERAAA